MKYEVKLPQKRFHFKSHTTGFQPIRSTTQTWVATPLSMEFLRSFLRSQLAGKPLDGAAKRRLISQAKKELEYICYIFALFTGARLL